MSASRFGKVLAALGLPLLLAAPAAPQGPRKEGFRDTPMLPDGKWHVHDSDRPQPMVITPGTTSTAETPGKPPSDAVILFNGSDLSGWKSSNGSASPWTVQEGAMLAGKGVNVSKHEFGDCQLHLEWSAPTPPIGSSQGRGNSGVLLFGRYEIQVLDCFENPTYADGTAGAIYGQYPPLVNPSRPPGQWQTYDILFTAPRFKADGEVETPAYVTLLFNGVAVHNHTPLVGAMAYRAVGKYTPHGPKGPLVLQDHGNPVRFRNIWVRELKPYDQP